MTTIIDHPIPDSNTAGLERVVVVTGATGGIGAAITHKLTEEGYTVLAHYGKNHERAHELTS